MGHCVTRHLGVLRIAADVYTRYLLFTYMYVCYPTCASRNTVETNTNQSMIVQIMCCRLGNGSLRENLKEVKIRDVNRAVSDCCVQIKTVIAEAFAEAFY